MSINFKAVTVAVNRVIENLLSDTTLAQDIIYKKYDSEAFNESGGFTVITYIETTIRAVKLKHNTYSQKLNVTGIQIANIQVGDTVYLIRNADLPSGGSLKDLIISGTETLKVKDLQDIFQLAWAVTTEST